MKISKQQWRWAAALTVLVLCAVLYLRAKPEPVSGGRPFSSWFHEAEMDLGVMENSPAQRAIFSLGADAVPFLVSRIRYKDARWVGTYWRQYPKIPRRIQGYFPQPRRPDARQETAALLLFEMGPPARTAVPEMIAVYDRAYLDRYHLPQQRDLDWTALLTNTPAAMLAAGPIQPHESTLRRSLLLTFARTGGNDKQMIPLLLASIHERNALLRGGVPNWLRSDNTNLTAAIQLSEPTLLAALTDYDPTVRATAAELLAPLVPHCPEVIAPLIKAANDPAVAVRRNALESLKKTRLDWNLTLSSIVPLLADQDSKVCLFAVGLLVKSAGGGAKFIPALNDSLSDTNPLIRLSAAQALRRFSAGAQAAIPKLQEHTREATEPDARVRQEAAKALQKIAPQAASP